MKAHCLWSLPISGEVLVPLDDKNFCRCECEDLLKVPYGELLRRRASRDSVEAVNARRYAQMIAGDGFSEDPIPAATIELDHGEWTTTRYRNSLCHRDEEVINFIMDLTRVFSSQMAEIIIDIQADGPTLFFPTITPLEDEDLTGPLYLLIPRRMLDDRAAGMELIKYMIVHEIGHAVMASQYERVADYWATSIGFPEYYGYDYVDGLAVGILNRVDAQLRAYALSVYTDIYAFHAVLPDEAPKHAYPNMDCRCMGIRGQLLPSICWQGVLQPTDDNYRQLTPEESILCEWGYPSECWDRSIQLMKYDELPFNRACTRQICFLPCPIQVFPSICQFRGLLMGTLSKADELPLIHDGDGHGTSLLSAEQESQSNKNSLHLEPDWMTRKVRGLIRPLVRVDRRMRRLEERWRFEP